MSEKYTAEEMRDVAKSLAASEVNLNFDKRDIAAMLRQAADAMEREKKYEYAVRDLYGEVTDIHNDTKIRAIDCKIDNRETIVRREVGEWKEVK